MTQEEKLGMLSDMFEVDVAELKLETPLDTLQWDSMAMLSLIALVKAKFNRRLPGTEIRGFKTIGDILKVME